MVLPVPKKRAFRHVFKPSRARVYKPRRNANVQPPRQTSTPHGRAGLPPSRRRFRPGSTFP